MDDNSLTSMRIVDAARAVMWFDGHITTSDQLNSDLIIRMFKAMQAANAPTIDEIINLIHLEVLRQSTQRDDLLCGELICVRNRRELDIRGIVCLRQIANAIIEAEDYIPSRPETPAPA